MLNLGSKIARERTAEVRYILRSANSLPRLVPSSDLNTHLFPAFYSLAILFGVFALPPIPPQYPLTAGYRNFIATGD